MRLLCASNLRLGRATWGVPDRLGIDAARLSMTAAWDALVDLARAEAVDAIVIAGDLIDRENRRFEPIGPIERGLTTLARHDIPVIAVAGDEDLDSLRALADSDITGALRLLGRDGAWETATVTGRDGDTVTIAAWSAPGRTVSRSPALDAPEELIASVAPEVVVLHGTLQKEGDPAGFAPIPIALLDGAPERLLITGSPMAPSVEHVGDTVVLTPGRIAALSPADTGQRGAWIVELGDEIDVRFVPLAAIRFDRVAVDLTGCADADDAETRVIAALHGALDAAVDADTGSHLVAVLAHLTVAGRTSAYTALPDRLAEIERTVDLQRRGVVLAITSVTDDTAPAIALETLLERADPAGETARVIQALDAADIDAIPTPYGELMHRTASRLEAVHRSRVFAAASGEGEPGLDATRALLRREAWATLDALVRQRGIDGDEGQP